MFYGFCFGIVNLMLKENFQNGFYRQLSVGLIPSEIVTLKLRLNFVFPNVHRIRWLSEQLIDKIKNKVWVGLYHFPYKTDNLHHIPNHYEFKVLFKLKEIKKFLKYKSKQENLIFRNKFFLNKIHKPKIKHIQLKNKK